MAQWSRLAPLAHDLGALTASDVPAETVRREGMVLATENSAGRAHPAVKVMETARTEAARLHDAFGFTPKGT